MIKNVIVTARLVLILTALLLWAGRAAADENPRVYGPTAPSAFILYALDPELLAGWNTPLRNYEKKYMPEKYQRLPVLGGWYGEGFIPDREVFLAQGIKKALFLSSERHDNMGIIPTLEKLGITVVSVPGELTRSPECFRLMGQLFDRRERGEALAVYAENALGKVRAAVGDLPPDKRPRIYLALQTDGLATICQDSERAEALNMAGGRAVEVCPDGALESTLQISFEQLMTLDPDFILVYQPALAAAIPTDARWSRLRAVKEGRVHLMPRGPFTWLERPATFMRLLGIQWLTHILHPDLLPLDIRQETKDFMRLFFHLDLSDQEVAALVNSAANAD